MLSFANTFCFAKQVYIADKHFCCIFNIILQLVGLRIAQPIGEPTTYQLDVDRRIVGPNHCKGMSSGGQNGVAVEIFEILPRCLASLNNGVWPLLPAVRMGRRFNVDAVEYWFYCGGYSVEVVFLDFGFLHQHIELRLGFMSVIYKNYNGSSRPKSITTLLPIRGYLPFNSSASLSARSDSFVFSCRICSTVWQSRLSSASCSASTKR